WRRGRSATGKGPRMRPRSRAWRPSPSPPGAGRRASRRAGAPSPTARSACGWSRCWRRPSSRSAAGGGRWSSSADDERGPMIPFLDLKAQHRALKGELMEAASRVLDSCAFALGEEVAAFEEEFAAYCQVKYAAGVNTGTSALHLALLAAG